jgi:hypothetical protein
VAEPIRRLSPSSHVGGGPDDTVGGAAPDLWQRMGPGLLAIARPRDEKSTTRFLTAIRLVHARGPRLFSCSNIAARRRFVPPEDREGMQGARRKHCSSSMAVVARFAASEWIVDLVDKLRPCLVHPENQKVFKFLRHIESCDTCMKY